MIKAKTLKALEFDKILTAVSDYAVLEKSKAEILSTSPACELKQAEFLLSKTKEAYKYQYTYNVNGIFYFSEVGDIVKRASMGGVLNNSELLNVASALKSSRLIKSAIESVDDGQLTLIAEIVSRLFTNLEFEKDISSKIISQDEISDNASPKLYSVRKNIKNLNAKIRTQLNSYMRGNTSKYLQESVVTMRADRFVIPVKSEYRSFVKGFIHDQSSSGSTVFIEPEMVMELNNELKTAYLDEANEIHKILADLSAQVASMAEALNYNQENIIEIDISFAKAQYSFKNKCTLPLLNDKGIVSVVNARHPLINPNSVVPVSFSIGVDFNFLLITGPNTGGKTVTLKLCGLLSAIASSGIFIPAFDDGKVAVFTDIFCDIGDEQSIEQSLSTFSSHMTNLIDIINNVNDNSLVLLDEIGAGTDPDEGSALALAVIERLLENNCKGIITTHYSRLKEYAMQNPKIENASMDFDSVSLKPLYKINIGIPGSSNAIDIAKILGLDESITKKATSYLTDNKVSFEKVLKQAEESRRKAEKLSNELEKLSAEKKAELDAVTNEKEKLVKEREKISITAKQEVKRIVADKLADAEEIIAELKDILKRAGLESREVFKASELKNRLKNSRYLENDEIDAPFELEKAKNIKVGERVYIKSLGVYAVVNAVKPQKNEAEIIIGNAKSIVSIDELYNSEKPDKKKEAVKVFQSVSRETPKAEINIIGKTSLEALTELELFVDQAIINGIEEIKVIHGIGSGVLLKTVRDYLKANKNILEYRKGKYGEGENGVTIAKLK